VHPFTRLKKILPREERRINQMNRQVAKYAKKKGKEERKEKFRIFV
jgi:hypothetical protein